MQYGQQKPLGATHNSHILNEDKEPFHIPAFLSYLSQVFDMLVCTCSKQFQHGGGNKKYIF